MDVLSQRFRGFLNSDLDCLRTLLSILKFDHLRVFLDIGFELAIWFLVTMSVHKCCVPNCGNSRSNDTIMHLFPNPNTDMEKFRTWIYAVGGDILTLENDEIFKLRRICHVHFESKYLTRSNRLAANAVPTLKLPGFSISKSQPLKNITNIYNLENVETSLQSTSKASIDQTSTEQPVLDVLKGPSTTKCNTERIEPVQSTSKASMEYKPIDPPVLKGVNKNLPLSVRYSNEASWLKKKLNKLQLTKNSMAARLKQALKLSKNATFQKAVSKFTAAALLFIMMQFRECKKLKTGRRFKKEEKVLALALYKQGPRAYRWLRKIFVLPSPLTLTRMISTASLKAGINENIFKELKTRAERMNPKQKLCLLLFDEISLMAHFDYNRKRDEIIGFVDNGEVTQYKIADHALVFMIRGIYYNYKQAVAYTFCAGSTPKAELAAQIKIIIRKLHWAGFKVLGTICDQGCSNVSAINLLIKETKEKYVKKNVEHKHMVFEIDEEEIIPIYDTPHLLKGIRNNLITKNLKCEIDGDKKTAKWDHILQLYKEDPSYQGIRLMPKLTDKHVIPQKIAKMKVKCASQLFSQSVSVNMGYLASKGIISRECEETADVFLFLDNLFDSLNGSHKNSKKRTGKPLLGPVTPSSGHHKIWSEAKGILRTMKFVTNNGYTVVPSISNWLQSIENIEYLVQKIFSKYDLASLWMRHFNQDPLENFFGSIRSHGYRNVTPSCAGFEAAFSSLLINNLSANHSPGSNCEQDSCTAFKSLKNIFFEKCESTKFSLEIDFDLLLCDNILVDLDIKKCNPKIFAQLQYVAGYVLGKLKKKVFKNCVSCRNNLIDEENNCYIGLKERSQNKKCLTYPATNLIKCFSHIQDIVIYVIRNNIKYKNIKDYLKTVLAVHVDYNFIICQNHKSDIIRVLQDISCNLFLYNWCKDVNKIINGVRTDVDQEDLIQKMAFDYCKKRIKKKK